MPNPTSTAAFTHSSGKLPAPVNGGLDELNRLRKERNEGAAAYASGDPDEAMAQWKRQNEIDAQIAALERSLKAQGVDTTLGDLDPIDAVHGTVWKGISGFAEGSAKALDLANRLGHYALGWTPEEYDAQDTLTAQLLSQQKENTRYWSERVAEDVQHDPAALAASDLGAAAVRAVPSAILAMLSSGASLAGETTAGLASAANTAGISSKTGQLADTLTRIVTNASQNPQFYSSFWNVVGEGYEKAKANGASEANAISYAAANGLFDALIEIGGGIEDTSGAKSFRETANEEGMEEVGQGVFERGLEWMYGKKNKPFSLRDPEAVVNPVTAAKEYTGGAAVGGLLGGVRTAVNALAADEYDGTDSPQAEADEAEEPGRRTQPSQQAEELNHPNLAIEAKETATENQHDVRMREKASADAIKEDMSDGGNRRMTEADIEKWMNTGTTGHRKHQKQRNIAAGLNVVLTSKDQIRNFITDAAKGKSDPQTRVYGIVGKNMAHDIMEASGGKEHVENHYLELPPNDIQHSYEDHLFAKQQGDTDLTMDDFVRIPDYIDTYDDIMYVEYPTGDAEIVVGKKIDGYAVIIELVAGKRQALMFKQMRGMSDAKYKGMYKKRDPAYSGGVQAQTANATTSKPGKNLSAAKITPEREKVNADSANANREAVKQADNHPNRSSDALNRATDVAPPPSRSAALEALKTLGDTPAGRRARSAADAAAQAFRYIREAAQRSDEAAYATALGVLRHSAKELSDLAASGALPEDAARAAEHVAAEIKTLPGKAMDLPAKHGQAPDELRTGKHVLTQETTDATMPVPGQNGDEIFIPIGIGAKAKDVLVRLPDGSEVPLTPGSRITRIELIAGKGRDRKIDEIEGLLHKYPGTKESEWQKKKGIGYVSYRGESYRAQIHFYEEASIGRVKFKLKPDAGGNWFIESE